MGVRSLALGTTAAFFLSCLSIPEDAPDCFDACADTAEVCLADAGVCWELCDKDGEDYRDDPPEEPMGGMGGAEAGMGGYEGSGGEEWDDIEPCAVCGQETQQCVTTAVRCVSKCVREATQ